VRKNSLAAQAKCSIVLLSPKESTNLGGLMLERFTRRCAKGLPTGKISSATIIQYPFTTSMT